MTALDELGEKTRLQNPNMTALEWFVWNERNEPLAEEAAEELAALRARVEELEDAIAPIAKHHNWLDHEVLEIIEVYEKALDSENRKGVQ